MIDAYLALLKDKNPEIAAVRMEICKQCPFFTMELLCSRCGCVMKAKTRNLNSKCPEGKW